MKREVKTKLKDFDVVVIGGGLSGICAAISASRCGAQTALIHARHVLGGNASSEIRMHVCGASANMDKPYLEEGGILYELMLENKAINDYHNFSKWDMVLYSAVKKTENLTVYFNTVMEECENEGNKITSVTAYQQTTETRYVFRANIFVDCTGDGTLGYLAGAEFRVGSEGKGEFSEPHAPDEANNERMGNTLLFKAVDRGHSVNFKRPDFARVFTEEELKYRTHSAFHTPKTNGNVDKAYLTMTTGSTSAIDYGYWWIEISGEGEDIIDEYEKIRDELVSCVYGVFDHLKNGGEHGAENYDLEWVGMLPGVRESRRLIGDYILNENDVSSQRHFEDAVAYGGWPMDIHTPKGIYDFDKLPSKIVSFEGAYTIPYRSYYSKNIENLFFAGRNISATKMAMGSTRVMGTCAIGGQAVGVASAMCVKYNCSPRDVLQHISELQQTLLREDCYIPGIKNCDELDLARFARVEASSHKAGFAPENVINGISRSEGEQSNLWVSDGISEGGEALTLNLGEQKPISEVRLTFDSNFNHPIKITLSGKRQSQQRVGVPPELVKDYTVSLIRCGEVVAQKEIKDNHQRLNSVKFDTVTADTVKITVNSTNGDANARIFEVRIY